MLRYVQNLNKSAISSKDFCVLELVGNNLQVIVVIWYSDNMFVLYENSRDKTRKENIIRHYKKT